MTRHELLNQLTQRIISHYRSHPLRVAIDGIDAAGKTTLSDELAGFIEARHRPVIRASIDGFHLPRAQRYRLGMESAKGYYEDSFDYESVREALLHPLGPEGSRLYRRAVYDYRQDAPFSPSVELAPEDAILLFDGIFLLRPELAEFWDYRIFVDVGFETALHRALVRDQELFGSAADVEARYLQRYFPAQRNYLKSVRPRERADVVVRNDDPEQMSLMVRESEAEVSLPSPSRDQ